MSGASQFVSVSFTVQWELNILQTLPLWCGEASSTSIIHKWCYGNASTQKQTNTNYRKSLKNWKVLRDIRIFLIHFRYIYVWLVFRFFIGFRILQVRFRCLEKVIDFQFVGLVSCFLSVSVNFWSASGCPVFRYLSKKLTCAAYCTLDIFTCKAYCTVKFRYLHVGPIAGFHPVLILVKKKQETDQQTENL